MSSLVGPAFALCPWEESNLRPCGSEPHALSTELQRLGGTHGGTRTPNLFVRSEALYPIELRGYVVCELDLKTYFSCGRGDRIRTCDLLDPNQTR